jgi:hypothetical protein
VDAESFRRLVAEVERDPALLAALLTGGTQDARLVDLLPEGRRRAAAGGAGAVVQARLAPVLDRRRLLLTAVGASCDGNVTCYCTSGTCGGVTCGGSTCDVTCSGDSCGSTCGDSCGTTTNLQSVAEQVTRGARPGGRTGGGFR